MRTLKISSLVSVALGSLALAACGSSAGGAGKGVASINNGTGNNSAKGATSTTLSVQDLESKYLAYAKCMRGKGAYYPDPQFDSSGRPTRGGNDNGTVPTGKGFTRETPQYDAARTACQSLRPQFAPRTPAERAQNQKSILAFAKCMRGKGVNFPDPQFDATTGRPIFGNAGGATIATGRGGGRGGFGQIFDNADPKTKAASTACRSQLGGGFGGGGPGGPGGPGGGNGGGSRPAGNG